MSISEQDAIRILIVMNAMNQIGSHYLNASDGGLPGLKDGLDGKDLKLFDDPDSKNVMIRTVRFNGTSCAGRVYNVSGSTFGKRDRPKMEDLEKYCEKIKELQSKGIPPESWDGFENGLYPRADVGVFPNKIVVSESCSGKRHFDCISFVQWILTKTLHKKNDYTYDIVQHEGWKKNDDTKGNNVAPGKRIFPPYKVSDLKNGDILVKIKWKENQTDDDGNYLNSKGEKIDNKYSIHRKHIGFFMVGGKVIEASGAANGVIMSNFKENDWTSIFRLHNWFLKFGP